MISTYAYDSSDDDLIPLNKKKKMKELSFGSFRTVEKILMKCRNLL